MNNDTRYTKEQLFERYGELPEDIRGVLINENLGPAIQIIGKNYGLTPTQSLEVEDEVVSVLLGVSKQKELKQHITTKLNTPNDTTEKIIAEIEERIFSQVKESLKKIQPSEEEAGVKIKVPSLSVEMGKPSLVSSLPKKEVLPTPSEPPSLSIAPTPQPTAPTKDTPADAETPVVPPVSPKPIVGAEKMGMGIPTSMDRTVPESSKEHLFEKKLREASAAMSVPSVPKKQAEVLQEKRGGGDIVAPEAQPKKMDPYREMAE